MAADPLAKALDALTEPTVSGKGYLIDQLFGDRPDVIASIRAAKTRGQSNRRIADALSTGGTRVSEGAVQSWCRKPQT